MIRTPEFRRWFRNSKIVDERGEPLVVYHGGFDVLNSRAGSFRRSAAGALGAGIYFTPDRSVAEYYAGSQGGHAETGGGALTEVYLSIQNPLVVSHASGHDPAIAALVLLGEPRARAEAKVERARERYGDVGKTIENAAVKADYDGILHYIDGALYEIVAFQPGQVKSATRNAGTYEFFDPDIRRNPDAFGPKERPANTSLMYDALHAAAGSALRAWMDTHRERIERHTPRRWFYHTTSGFFLDAIGAEGITPSARSIKMRGTPVVFASPNVYGAVRYFIDREDPYLLRFPDPGGGVVVDREETVFARAIPAASVEVYDGTLLDPLLDAYHLGEEEREDALGEAPVEDVERDTAWVPLAEFLAGG
jgi:hypothetical protein